MKKNFLKFLPLVAAVLFSTSCSKDENNEINNPEKNNALEIPFSVQVKTGSGISKISYANGESGVTPSFETDDVNNLVLVVTGDGITEGNLTLQNTDGKFSGTLKFENDEAKTAVIEGTTELSGTMTVAGSATSSTESISDLMIDCGHVYTASSTETGDIAPFNFNTTEIYLCDDKSYLEVTWTNKGKQDVTIGSSKYTLNEDGKIWIAVAAGTSIVSDDLGIKSEDKRTTVAGKIYTISRVFSAVPEGYVDLGLSDGTLWAAENETGGDGTEKNGVWYYTFAQAQNLGVELPRGGDGNDNDFKKLYNECYWEWDDTEGHKGYYVFKSKDKTQDHNLTKRSGVTYSTSTDNYIFLPAAGGSSGSGLYSELYVAGIYGYCWSSAGFGGLGGYCLYFDVGGVNPNYLDNSACGFPVRSVRRSN